MTSRTRRALGGLFVLGLLGGPARTAAAEGYTLEYATYVGGSNWDRVQSVFVAPSGEVYVGGSTKSGDFPTTPGAYDRTGSSQSDNDGFVAKFTSTGQLVWATYLQGSARDDVYGVRADSAGNVYVAGWTASSDFPTTSGAFDRTHNGSFDVFAAKISSDGSTLLWSTLIGGSGKDQCRGGMALDAAGRLVVSGMTGSTDFPTTPSGFQRTYGGDIGDAFVAVLSPDGSRLEAATYLGGSGPDFGFDGVVLHADGSVSIAGVAGAADFPTTSGAVQTSFGGAGRRDVWYGDAFVARLLPDLSGLVFSTFLGGSDDDIASAQNSLARDAAGNLVVAGSTFSPDFPTTARAFQSGLRGSKDLFVARISADGSQLLAATYFGGATGTASSYNEASGVAVDGAGNVYLGGATTETDYPVTSGALQPVFGGGGTDAFLAKFSPDLGLLYSTYVGGSGGVGTRNERGRSVGLGPGGTVLLVGDTNSSDFPVTAGAYQGAPRGQGDGYWLRLAPFGTVLGSFTADPQPGAVVLSWTTTSEVGLDGFHVYRSDTAVGGYARQNGALIQGSSPYSWTDTGVQPDRTYYYRLGAVDLSGREVLFGPVSATTPGGSVSFDAVVEDRSVRLTWSVAPGSGGAGFHVYRSDGAAGAYARRTPAPLPPDVRTWLDTAVEAGTTYYYKLGVVDSLGQEALHGPVSVTTPDAAGAGSGTMLYAPRPNPFVGSVDLRFTLAAPAEARLAVYDGAGRLVRTILNGPEGAGEHARTWDGRDDRGRPVPAGFYLARLVAGGVQQTRKMVLLGVR